MLKKEKQLFLISSVKYSSTALTKSPSGKSSPSKINDNEGKNKEKTKPTTEKTIGITNAIAVIPCIIH